MSRGTGRFLVTETDDRTAVLRAVDDGQIYTIAENPGLCAGTVITAELAEQDGVGGVWTIEAYEPYPLEVVSVDDPPAASAREAVADADIGELRRLSREWGERHVLTVPDVKAAIQDIRTDPATRSRAARRDAHRVVIRGKDGVVTVSYRQTPQD